MSWHRLRPADETFAATAPQVLRFEIESAVPPQDVWASLSSDESLGAWPMPPGMKLGVRWTSPRPFGIGTTREVTLPGKVITVRERFFRWDEGEGYSFFVEEANRPGLRRLTERLEETGIWS